MPSRACSHIQRRVYRGIMFVSLVLLNALMSRHSSHTSPTATHLPPSLLRSAQVRCRPLSKTSILSPTCRSHVTDIYSNPATIDSINTQNHHWTSTANSAYKKTAAKPTGGSAIIATLHHVLYTLTGLTPQLLIRSIINLCVISACKNTHFSPPAKIFYAN